MSKFIRNAIVVALVLIIAIVGIWLNSGCAPVQSGDVSVTETLPDTVASVHVNEVNPDSVVIEDAARYLERANTYPGWTHGEYVAFMQRWNDGGANRRLVEEIAR